MPQEVVQTPRYHQGKLVLHNLKPEGEIRRAHGWVGCGGEVKGCSKGPGLDKHIEGHWGDSLEHCTRTSQG